MVARQQSARSAGKARGYEDAENGRVGRIAAAVALYGAALALGYVTLAAPQAGTAMGSVRDVLVGLAGDCALILPLMLAWVATLALLPAVSERRVSPIRVVMDGALFLLLLTAVQLFFAPTVRARMAISGFANFCGQSWRYGRGGGLLGALLAWPLFKYVGVWGGLLVTIMLACLSQTLTGRLPRFFRWAQSSMSDASERRAERRAERESEEMFAMAEEEEARRARAAEPGRDDVRARRASADGLRRRADDLRRPSASPDPRRTSDDRRRSAGDPRRSTVGARRASSLEDPRRSRAAQRLEGASRRPVYRDAEASEVDRRAADPQGMRRRPAASRAARRDPEGVYIPDRRNRGSARTEAPIPMDDAARRSAPAAEADEDVRRNGVHPVRPEPVPAVQTAPDAQAMPDAQAAPAAQAAPVAQVAPAAQVVPAEEAPAPESRTEKKAAATEAKPAAPDFDPLAIEPDRSEVIAGDSAGDEVPVKKPLGKMRRPMHAEAPQEEPYNYPPIDLLKRGERVAENHRDSDMRKAELLADTLSEFGIATELTGIAHGPAVTRFELLPAPGVKVARITSLADDIAMHLAAMSVRIEAPIPGKAAVGVEIPNEKVEMVRLRDVLESPEARKCESRIAVGLGKDNSGRYIVGDIAKMPHVLIAGQTGSGKSVCINSIIASILYRATPEEVRMILIDPKVVELSVYNGIPHLVCPVVTDCKKAASALEWAVGEMTTRYKRFSERGVRNISHYNKKLEPGERPMPQMVIIIDELADLMMVAPGEVEDSICRLAQLARAAGMHLVIATQRPSVNVITGIIKANIPSRIAFSVASQVDSRTMIDHGGAEKLLGNGDMLFVPSGINKPIRVQGAWISDEEVQAVVNYIKERSETDYDPDMIEQMDNAVRSDAEREEAAGEYDPRLPEAVEIVVEAGQASVSMLQRRMRVGYARAGRLIDEMEQRGIVSVADGAKPRTVLISREQLAEMFEDE